MRGSLNRLGDLGPLTTFVGSGWLGFRLVVNRSGSAWLLPKSPGAVPHAANVFAPSGRGQRLIWGIWRLGLPLGQHLMLQSEFLEDLSIAAGLQTPATGAVVYIGTPGAYRKALVGLWINASAEAMVKLALLPLADVTVGWEVQVLQRLRTYPSLMHQMPRILQSGIWRGRKFHVMEPLLGVPGPANVSEQHLEWCKNLFEVERQEYIWEECPLRRQLEQSFSRMANNYPGVTVLQRALGLISQRLSGRRLSFGWAHRDFAPWNSRLVRNRLVVFDWEMARPGRPPAYDLLHFHALPAALRSASPQIPWDKLRSWISYVSPDWSGLEECIYLLYLLDQTALYGEARIFAPDIGSDRVLQWLTMEVRRVLEEMI